MSAHSRPSAIAAVLTVGALLTLTVAAPVTAAQEVPRQQKFGPYTGAPDTPAGHASLHYTGFAVLYSATWPLDDIEAISSHYGLRTPSFRGASSDHKGTDWAVPLGAPLYAIADGAVVEVSSSRGGYGNKLATEHLVDGHLVRATYGHMLAPSILPVGEPVSFGEVIGQVGSTGVSSGPHLHFELTVDGVLVDPVLWLNANARGSVDH